MPAYYSEFDPKAAAWLRELIKRGLIADGVVDERDLWDVAPADLRDFTQVHLCAGIGVWSYSLRSAGWPDDRPVWTGSFPCQPFSAAGKGEGFADERHLWPAGCHLIAECRPSVIFGEQVASKDAEPWLDLVQDDLEALDYAVGAVPFPSAGVGAPHIRDRLYWVADAVSERRRLGQSGDQDASDAALAIEARGLGGAGGAGLEGQWNGHRAEVGQRQGPVRSAAPPNEPRELEWRQVVFSADCDEDGNCPVCGDDFGECDCLGPTQDGVEYREVDGVLYGRLERTVPEPGPTNGLWRDADWLFCRDGKWRPVEPGTFPLAHGSPARVGRLRGYGNAINAEAAKVFIEAYLDTRTIEAGA